MMRRRRISNRMMHQYQDSASSPGSGQLCLSDTKPDIMILTYPEASKTAWRDARE